MKEHDKKVADLLDKIIDRYIKVANHITKAFGFKSNTMISNLRNNKHPSTINQLYMDGLEKYFDIPKEVWENVDISDNQLDKLIVQYRKNKKSNQIDTIFSKNQKLFNKLKGVWYAYLYASNPNSAKESEGIWIVQTTINNDYSVVDYWGNRGYLKLGKNESLIIKESYDNNDLTIIRFPNRQVPSQHFRFVIVSNQNNTENEMVNFGFYSKVKYSAKEAKRILGDKNKMQLKLDIEFNNRLNQEGIVPK
jgi:hypothetical protein